MKTDFLVIGSGIAGLNFALEASRFGEVLIVTKKDIVESNTNYAQGGIAAVLEKTDSFKEHIKDTLEAGCFHNDKEAVRIMVEEGPLLVKKLSQVVPFQHDDKGNIKLTKEGGHGARRIAFCGDATGFEIEKALVKSVRENPKIKVLEHTFVSRLIKHNEEIIGVEVLDDHTGKARHIFSKGTILASGGAGQLFYPHTTNPSISTGDGMAMGLLASCKLKDMEFFQFHPTALFVKGLPTFLLSESLRGEGAKLLNYKGDSFMEKYDKKKELAPRDIVARAIVNEEKNGPCYLDMRHFKKNLFEKHFKKINETLNDYGINPKTDLVPISPAAHYTIGGIEVDYFGYTGVGRLYAFGEVACTGVHGANRLGSNSLLEALVFSHRIVQKLDNIMKNEILEVMPKQMEVKDSNIDSIHRIGDSLRVLMWKYVGIVRKEKELQVGLEKLRKLKQSICKLKCHTRDFFEVRNMILIGEKVIEAAISRKNSLGAHYVEN